MREPTGVHQSCTNLRFNASNQDHILEQALQNAFNFQKESGRVSLLGVDTTSKALFVNLVPGCPRESIENIKARYFGYRWQRFVSAVEDRYQLSIMLDNLPSMKVQEHEKRHNQHTCIDLSAISVNLPIFEADKRFAWTTSFNIVSKSCSTLDGRN